MSHSVIRFPPPPPTSNNLTAEQRAQLMRTNKKLGQLLGSTPHVLDFCYTSASSRSATPVRVTESKPLWNVFKKRGRSKSTPRVVDEDDEDEDDFVRVHAPPRPSTSTSSASSVKSHGSVDSERLWRTPYRPSQLPPLLQLVPPKSKSKSKPRPEAVSSSQHEGEDEVSAPDSPGAPAFNITSDAAMRRNKMLRLTRKLGEGVPVDLVFPQQTDADSEDEIETPLPETPASDTKLPFSYALPTISEDLPSEPRSPLRHDTASQPPRKTSFAREYERLPSYYDAVRVVDGPDEHGAGVCAVAPPPPRKERRGRRSERSAKTSKDEQMVCLGVSASAGMNGKGFSRRWVRGQVPYDQIVAGAWTPW
ncbi:uncharacterized protein LAESUDRAFT_739990 [Laetiporus sulphureus 93-53]|uniref:Uncharacterized protein n=1 Tax=Laetiporus sulphureus 93-53 TaxID=1314785 RepID=A0A165I620_9APHY|nr:uncharacterized protein LAESUDRAFT_739990 [Laetiporus sulphureus 93-53]KZT12639.1 hypothetical protein LAESUDRAFT_739990 [Laetiporus sulphureus 93-53]